jgi:uncharacterized RDD family membrane protein YckC
MTTEMYGGFWKRFFAYLIDKMIIYALSINICIVAVLAVGLGSDIKEIMFSAPEEISGRIGAFTTLCLLFSLLIDMIYFTLFHGIAGQTPGKMLFRLQVTAVSGLPITIGTAFLRWVGYMVSGFFFFLGFLWVALDRKKQGWHDKIAMTQVVYKTNKPTTPGASYPEEPAIIPVESHDAANPSPDPDETGNLAPGSDGS